MALDTIEDLLTAVDALAPSDRAEITARLERALERPAPSARAFLGLIALDVAGLLADQGVGDTSTEQPIVLPEPLLAVGA